MTDLTPLYKLPSPQLLVGAADGPADIQALAARTERELPQLRATSESNSDLGSVLVGPGQATVAYSLDVSVAVIGWIEVDCNVVVAAALGGSPVCAGLMIIRIGGSVVRNVRYHNQAAQNQWLIAGRGSYSVVAGQTTVPVEIVLTADGLSSVIVAHTANIGVCQYGAPASG